MNPQEPNSSTSPQQPLYGDQSQVRNPLEAMQPGEQVICQIKRHPIGMIGIYAVAGIILVVLAVLAFVVIPSAASDANHHSALTLSTAGFILFAFLTLVFVFISNIVYWGNHWVVTSDSITQIQQTSLFRKQSSQLSLGNLEDVTVDKNGILPTMFNYGILKAETAGERSKFMFLFCPTPNMYAQQILSARERFEQNHRGGKQPSYPSYVPPSPSLDLPTANNVTQTNATWTSPQSESSQQNANAGQPGYGAYQPSAPAEEQPEKPNSPQV